MPDKKLVLNNRKNKIKILKINVEETCDMKNFTLYILMANLQK